MNRRSFLTRFTTALAVVPALKPLVTKAKTVTVTDSAPPLKPDGGQVILIMGRTKMGKTSLAEEIATQGAIEKKQVALFDSALNVEDVEGWPYWRKERMANIARLRAEGSLVIVTHRLNRMAQTRINPADYLKDPPIVLWGVNHPYGCLADWVFFIEGKSFSSGSGAARDWEVRAWRCRTLKDRFGTMPDKFTYIRNGEEFCRVPYHTDGVKWAHFS